MMATATGTKRAMQLSLMPRTWARLRSGLSNRKVLALLALAVIGAGLAFNWSWLVAAGVAPILIALAPCAAMCALGLCMSNADGKSCSGPMGDAASSAQPNNDTARDRQ